MYKFQNIIIVLTIIFSSITILHISSEQVIASPTAEDWLLVNQNASLTATPYVICADDNYVFLLSNTNSICSVYYRSNLTLKANITLAGTIYQINDALSDGTYLYTYGKLLSDGGSGTGINVTKYDISDNLNWTSSYTNSLWDFPEFMTMDSNSIYVAGSILHGEAGVGKINKTTMTEDCVNISVNYDNLDYYYSVTVSQDGEYIFLGAGCKYDSGYIAKHYASNLTYIDSQQVLTGYYSVYAIITVPTSGNVIAATTPPETLKAYYSTDTALTTEWSVSGLSSGVWDIASVNETQFVSITDDGKIHLIYTSNGTEYENYEFFDGWGKFYVYDNYLYVGASYDSTYVLRNITLYEEEVEPDLPFEFISINDLTNNSHTPNIIYQFNWTKQTDTDNYVLEIANDSDFTDITFNLSDINEVAYGVNYTDVGDYIEFNLPADNQSTEFKDYYFRIQYVKIDVWSGWSDWWILTRYNSSTYPTISNPSPLNNAEHISINPTLTITISDAEGNTMNQSFWTNASGTWNGIGWNNNSANATISNSTSVFTDCETWYYWSSNLTDGTYWLNNTYRFKTQMYPDITSISPYYNETNVNPLPPTLTITISDAEGDSLNITFMTNITGEWGDIGINTSVNNGTYIQTNNSMVMNNTTYYWSINVTDGTCWTNETYLFTSANILVNSVCIEYITELLVDVNPIGTMMFAMVGIFCIISALVFFVFYIKGYKFF